MAHFTGSGQFGSGSDRVRWSVQEEPFEAEETGFLCDGDQEPLQPDRSTELALEGWNLKKSVLDLNSQIVQLRSELRTQRNLTKNLQRINNAVQQENVSRSRDNMTLKNTVATLEKKLEELTEQNETLTTTLGRQKRMATTLQTRVVESDKAHALKVRELEAVIEAARAQSSELQNATASQSALWDTQKQTQQVETGKLLQTIADLRQQIVQLEKGQQNLEQELAHAQALQHNAASHLNHELEKAYESLHSKFETVIARADEFRLLLMEYEHEKEQIMSYMLSEGLQMPHLVPLNTGLARERIRAENEESFAGIG